MSIGCGMQSICIWIAGRASHEQTPSRSAHAAYLSGIFNYYFYHGYNPFLKADMEVTFQSYAYLLGRVNPNEHLGLSK